MPWFSAAIPPDALLATNVGVAPEVIVNVLFEIAELVPTYPTTPPTFSPVKVMLPYADNFLILALNILALCPEICLSSTSATPMTPPVYDT